jgi:signal transduction histidine kinase
VRRYDVEIFWWAFVLLNVWAMLMFRAWATVPFHFIWISLTIVYGWRVWSWKATWWVVGVVVVITSTSLIQDVISGGQEPDELAEIPLMATVFVVMVVYVRRAVSAKEQTEVVSQRNLDLLQKQTRFVQDASHMLRTPLTVALGHAELLRLSVSDAEARTDLQAVIDELNRLRKITDQLLSLAASQQPDFVSRVVTPVDELVETVLGRWTRTDPRVHVGRLEPAKVLVDRERIRNALDELISNALTHAPAQSAVTVSARSIADTVVLAVSDEGPGVSEEDQQIMFDRWARLSSPRRNGVGLGLAIVRAIAEAHDGSADVLSRPGHGSTFEIRLPVFRETAPARVLEPDLVDEHTSETDDASEADVIS